MSFFEDLQAKIEEVRQAEKWVMDLDLEHVDYHARRTTAELWVVGRLVAKYYSAEEKAKRELKKAEAVALMRAMESGGKKYQAEARAVMDEEVEDAHNHWCRMLELRKSLEALYDALRRKSDKLPGLQGRANRIFEMESGR